MALRAVQEGEKPPRNPLTVSQAAKEGSTRDLLVAMRDRIATAVQDLATPPRDLAALTKRLTEVVLAIEAIDAREKEATDDGPSDVPDESFDVSAL